MTPELRIALARIVNEQWSGLKEQPSMTGVIGRVIYRHADLRNQREAEWQVEIGATLWGVRPKSAVDCEILDNACGRVTTLAPAKQPWEVPREKWTPWTKAKACAWMAFCKGLATLGNRDAGEHREVFERWWLNYGARDAGEA